MTDPSTHATHDELVLHYYGEGGADAARVAAHVSACATCQASLEHLRRTLALVDTAPEGEPPAGYEATLWARLQDQLEAPQPWWRRWTTDGPVRWAMAGTLAAVLVGAFLAGWLAREVAAPPPAPTAASAAPVRTRVLIVAVGDHLERTQMVLSDVLNTGDLTGAELVGDRARASDLVSANRLFRQSAALAGDASMHEVLEDLERLLVEIANAPADLSAAELDALRERIERRGLVFRVRALSDDLRVRQQDAPPVPAKGSTS